ncbi:aluminum-activated malate transporter 4-like [Andrographis paniculata]|uniref:aluminum-activated malate transporter 4-like n=1 Tax=Andrographis paniculata TaxID=175694 RepID=UPI0021E75D00|nr:aluminum-activated malate transporter 4-like [Andrographis paniculata]
MAARIGPLSEESKSLLSRQYYSDDGESGDSFIVEEGCCRRAIRSTEECLSRWWDTVKGAAVKSYEMGRSDPRKVIFAVKNGGALALVSVLILFKVPLSYTGQYSIWALLTVVVVFEFSIGATLNKGFNRALGTFSAGTLALGIAQLSMMVGPLQEIFIVLNIFVAGFLASYLKLYPAMKQYEYGFRVFMLTFCIVLVSGTSHFFQRAISRLMLIGVGASVCLVVNICIYPIWAGEDLHKLVVKNFKGVAASLEGCVTTYLQCIEYTRIPSKILVYQAFDDPVYKGYRAAVESTSQEDALLGFAVWEPPHGRYKMFKYPWSEYVKLSGALRHCAFMVMAMHGCILAEIQATSELRQVFKKEIQRVGTAGAQVLRLLGDKVERMEKLPPGDLLHDIHEAAEDLQLLIDQKSYLLVNAESWESDKRPAKFADPEALQELKDGDYRPMLINSLAESGQQRSTPRLLRNHDLHHNNNNPSMSINSSSQWGSSSGDDMLRQQTMWPSRLSLVGENFVPSNAREAQTYESASALSLANYTSLLIEFVARLQNLVNSFQEVSEKAKFKDPPEPAAAAEEDSSSEPIW